MSSSDEHVLYNRLVRCACVTILMRLRLQAFVKARGDGLGFDLGRVEFEAVPSSSSLTQSVTARLDGKALDR